MPLIYFQLLELQPLEVLTDLIKWNWKMKRKRGEEEEEEEEEEKEDRGQIG